MARVQEQVEYRVYDIERVYYPLWNEPSGEIVEVEVINYTRKENHKFTVFLDELRSESAPHDPECSEHDCDGCKDFHEVVIRNLSSAKEAYSYNWPDEALDAIYKPRGIKFTAQSLVAASRPKSFDKVSRLNYKELQCLRSAIIEAIRRHKIAYSSTPYLAIPQRLELDNLYKRVLINESSGLPFRAKRATINSPDEGCDGGSVYVIY